MISTLIDLIIGFLGLIIKAFDDHTEIISSQSLQNVYLQIKQARLNPLSKTQAYHNHLLHTFPPTNLLPL
jgi:hypothetical protein